MFRPFTATSIVSCRPKPRRFMWLNILALWLLAITHPAFALDIDQAKRVESCLATDKSQQCFNIIPDPTERNQAINCVGNDDNVNGCLKPIVINSCLSAGRTPEQCARLYPNTPDAESSQTPKEALSELPRNQSVAETGAGVDLADSSLAVSELPAPGASNARTPLNLANSSLGSSSLPPRSSSSTPAVQPGCDALPRVVMDENTEIMRQNAAAANVTFGTVGEVAVDQAYACIQPLIKLIKTIHEKAKAIGNSFLPSIAAAVGIAAGNILGALFNQLIDNIVNAVCTAGNQVFAFLKSGLTDGICLKNPGKGLNPFSFDLKLKPFECAGFSIDLLNGGIKGDIGLGVDLSNLGAQVEAARERSQANFNNTLNQINENQQMRDLITRSQAPTGFTTSDEITRQQNGITINPALNANLFGLNPASQQPSPVTDPAAGRP